MREELLEAFASRAHVVICGGMGAKLLPLVLSYKDPLENTVVITESFEPHEHCQVLVVDLDHSRLDLLRAALRQDPDCIAIDLWSLEIAEMVLQTALTGHRLILGVPDRPPPEFFEYGLQMVVIAADGSVTKHGAPPAPPEPNVQPPATLPEHWTTPRAEPLSASLERRLEARTCWIPQFGEPSDHRGSKFGGLPALQPGESWPRCQCDRRMQLVAQLDLSQLPVDASQGYFQLFYCTAPDCSVHDAWEPFAGNSLCRLIPAEPVVEPTDPPLAGYSEARIAGWLRAADFPHGEERPELPEDEREAAYLASSWAEILEGDEVEKTRLAAFLDYYQMSSTEELARVVRVLTCDSGDKILGWPSWTQAARYPACPTCAKPMHYWLQINNESGFFPQLFAADGTGHVFRCADHPDQMGFAWACT